MQPRVAFGYLLRSDERKRDGEREREVETKKKKKKENEKGEKLCSKIYQPSLLVCPSFPVRHAQS